MGGQRRYDISVFINCPFDEEYRPIFEALVFAVFDCGFVARCALEFPGSGATRVDNILSLVRECKLGIHDISRTETSEDSGLPRFNMPLELGMFLGAMKLGTSKQKTKECLILDREQYRYQQFISDISGQDVYSHNSDYRVAIRRVRDWLNAVSSSEFRIPGGTEIADRYEGYKTDLPGLCKQVRIQPAEITFTDIDDLVSGWIQENPWQDPH